MYRHYKALAYGLIGYSFGVTLDLIMTKLTENKYEKHYKTISYKKTLYGSLSILGVGCGLSYGFFSGYNNKFLSFLFNISSIKV